MYVSKGPLDGPLIALGGRTKIDDKDCEGGDLYGVTGVKSTEHVSKARKAPAIGGADEKTVKDAA